MDEKYAVIVEQLEKDRQLAVAKIFRSWLKIGLKEANDMVAQEPPIVVAENFSQKDAINLQQELEEAGVQASIQNNSDTMNNDRELLLPVKEELVKEELDLNAYYKGLKKIEDKYKLALEVQQIRNGKQSQLQAADRLLREAGIDLNIFTLQTNQSEVSKAFNLKLQELSDIITKDFQAIKNKLSLISDLTTKIDQETNRKQEISNNINEIKDKINEKEEVKAKTVKDIEEVKAKEKAKEKEKERRLYNTIRGNLIFLIIILIAIVPIFAIWGVTNAIVTGVILMGSILFIQLIGNKSNSSLDLYIHKNQKEKLNSKLNSIQKEIQNLYSEEKQKHENLKKIDDNIHNLRKQKKQEITIDLIYKFNQNQEAIVQKEKAAIKDLEFEWQKQQSKIQQIWETFDTVNFSRAPENYTPLESGMAPECLRMGDLIVEQLKVLNKQPERVPALIPIRHLAPKQPGHIAIFSSDVESRKNALSAIQYLAFQAMVSFPVRSLKGILIDPVSMGNNFPFKDIHSAISGTKTFTRSDDVKEQLRGLTEHVEQVIQNYLGTKYDSIEEYNEAAQSVAEAYRYLFVADFPAGFDRNSWEDLKSILLNGSKAGVYVVLHIDKTLEKPRDFDYSLFENYCTVLRPSFGMSVGATPKKGQTYAGYVTNIIDTGAYVEFLPGIEGFVQTSNLSSEDRRVRNPRTEVSEGDRIIVKVRQTGDSNNAPELTCKDIHPKEAEEAKKHDFRSSQDKNQVSTFQTQLPNNLTFNLELAKPLPNKDCNQIVQKLNEAVDNKQVETVPFQEFYPKEQSWNSEYKQFNSTKEIRAPIGFMGAKDPLEFWFGENKDGLVASQALLAGKPGAGKSFTLHAIILSLAMRYSPDELEMYLLDFKEGVEFQIYVDPEKSEPSEEPNEEKALPHAKVVSIESDREFGMSVLSSIQEEIEKRGKQFKEVGVADIKNYRNKTGRNMPRIFVVIDEFQYLFQERDDITQQLNQIFEDITRRGRAFGIHMLLSTQSPNIPNMSSRIYRFIEVRLAQQMDKNTAASVLAEGNTDAVDLIDRPGKVIYNYDYGKKGNNNIGQVADVSSEKRVAALQYIQQLATQNNYQRQEPLIVFYGSSPAKLTKNRKLMQLSQMLQWLPSKQLNKQILQEDDWIAPEKPGIAWLGEAMRIGVHTRAIFRSRARSNMLLIGASEEIIFGMFGGILLSLVHCYHPENVQFHIVDLSQQDEEYPWSQLSVHFRDAFSDLFAIQLGKRFPEKENNILRGEQILQQTYEEFEKRKQQKEEDPDQMDFGKSLFFIYALGGLNRAQNMRPGIGRRGEEPSEDAKKLNELISQGPELGIHTILWMDDMKGFMKLKGDNKSWLTHFDLRVGLKMPGDDSRTLLGETDAESLPRWRGYFKDEATVSGLEKFKPYAVPSKTEVDSYAQQLKQRS